MKPGEKGYTYLEMVLAVAIMALAAVAASTVIFQVLKGTEHTNNHMTVVRQVQNAGQWISRDTQMAQSVITDNLTSPDFLVLNWTEWESVDDEIYHSVTYFFDDLTGGIGKLKRSHWSSNGTNEQTLIAQYIYYNPADSDNTSKASNLSPPILSVKLTAVLKEAREVREYSIKHRPNY